MTHFLKLSPLLFPLALVIAVPGTAWAANEEGAKVAEQVCSACHTAKVRPIDKMHHTRAEWAEAVERMKGYGAEVPNDKLPALLDYLAAEHGPATGAAPPK